MTARFRHRAGIAAASLAGLVLGVAFMLALMWQFAHAQPVDPVVASDHALRTVATVAPADAPDPPPSFADRALRFASKPTWVALGFALMVVVARLLAIVRERKRWARHGWVGYASGGIIACLSAAGIAGAISGSTDAAGLAMAGALVTAAGYAADPETARVKREASGEDVPT